MRASAFAVIALGPGIGLAMAASRQAAAGADASSAVSFETQVRPILEKSCLSCHGGPNPSGGLSLTSRAGLLKGGKSGPAFSAANPQESLLLRAVQYLGPQMPPSGKLPQKQIDVLARWIRSGALWPEKRSQPEPHGAPKVTPEAKQFWSFRPLTRPPVPQVRSAQRNTGNPIDAFIAARLEKEGLTQNPPASRTALIRRAYYDLIGLPPTPDEVRAFLQDRSPNAFEKVVDRLLASPQYGEKWGRHWLDLVRYAETNSYERDGAKPFAWRYRDYVIHALNQDKPFDQFILEQLAGDELGEQTPERLIATGFYRLGLWDDEPADPEQALYDDLDDIASTTSQVFLGLTMNCARCHDHKLDPIPQKDYYRFLAFFRGVRRYGVRSEESVAAASLRSIASEEDQQRFAAESAAHREKLEQNQKQLAEIEKIVIPDFSPVEQEEFKDWMKRAALLRKRVPRLLSQEQLDRYTALRGERVRLQRNPPRGLEMALCVTEVGREVPETRILLRGNPHVPGDLVRPGFPEVLGAPDPEIIAPSRSETSGRRLALARWIASRENPLTARVIANRVWQYHFGRGIVRSPSNFGFQGDRPTHPELLDWLASELIQGSTDRGGPDAKPWSLKRLHRLIMTSAVYQQSSAQNPRATAKDPENDLFWRFDMRRLQAEEVRDSILAVNGSLNLQMGGPSFYAAVPDVVLAGQSMPGAGWGKSPPDQQRRRSVYIHVKRSLTTPIIASFDGPDTDSSCAVRFATTQPTQALGMINSDFINEQARVFADYLRREAGESADAQVRLCLWRVTQREPTGAEVARGVRRIHSFEQEDGLSREEALRLFCVIAYNLNEFIYLD